MQKIKATILDDETMEKIGFRNHNTSNWFFLKEIKFPQIRKFAYISISFSVSIPRNGDDIRIDVFDEDFGKPYDYQRILRQNPTHEIANIVKEQVEMHMEYLQNSSVLSGHMEGGVYLKLFL